MQLADKINIALALIAALSAVMSLAVVYATFRILKATERSAAVMEAQLLASLRPNVEVAVRISQGSTAISLVVRNTGNSTAEHVRLTMDRDFFFNGEAGAQHNIRGMNAFKTPFAALGSKSELKFLLGVGHAVFNRPALCPMVFQVKAEYSFAGVQIVETSTVDLTPYVHTAIETDPAVQQLTRIAKNSDTLVEILST